MHECAIRFGYPMLILHTSAFFMDPTISPVYNNLQSSVNFQQNNLGLFAVYMAEKALRQWQNTYHFGGLVQDCSNSRVLAMELMQFCAKLSIYNDPHLFVASSLWRWCISHTQVVPLYFHSPFEMFRCIFPWIDNGKHLHSILYVMSNEMLVPFY